jgi:hypothetical protein
MDSHLLELLLNIFFTERLGQLHRAQRIPEQHGALECRLEEPCDCLTKDRFRCGREKPLNFGTQFGVQEANGAVAGRHDVWRVCLAVYRLRVSIDGVRATLVACSARRQLVEHPPEYALGRANLRVQVLRGLLTHVVPAKRGGTHQITQPH